MLFGLVPAEMEVRIKYLEISQAEFECACKHSGAQLGGLFSRHAKSLWKEGVFHLMLQNNVATNIGQNCQTISGL